MHSRLSGNPVGGQISYVEEDCSVGGSPKLCPTFVAEIFTELNQKARLVCDIFSFLKK